MYPGLVQLVAKPSSLEMRLGKIIRKQFMTIVQFEFPYEDFPEIYHSGAWNWDALQAFVEGIEFSGEDDAPHDAIGVIDPWENVSMSQRLQSQLDAMVEVGYLQRDADDGGYWVTPTGKRWYWGDS